MRLVLSIAGNLALNLALDKTFGPFGAAWSTVLTELIVAGSLIYFIRDRSLYRPVAGSIVFVAVAAAERRCEGGVSTAAADFDGDRAPFLEAAGTADNARIN